MLKIRDEAKENEIIYIKRAEAEKTASIYSSGDNADDSNMDDDNVLSKMKLKTRIRGSRKNTPSNSSSLDLMKSDTGHTFVLEYIAPRRSCRVNIKISAFANGKNETNIKNGSNVMLFNFVS